MTLENSSLELLNSLRTLRESMADLLRIITEDGPDEHALAYHFENSTSDVLGRLDAALKFATALQQIADHYDYAQACSDLGSCHVEFHQAAEKSEGELKSFDWLQDLYTFGHEHPERWMGWVTSIKATLDQCCILPVYDALQRCWQSLVVSAGVMSTRRVKNINQQIIPQEAK